MKIDRRSLVTRHNPRLTAYDAYSRLSVGNGELAFTADPSGLQTFSDDRPGTMPLCTQAQWGWHSFPSPLGEDRGRSALHLQAFDIGGRSISYASSETGQEELFRDLRINPHRLNLARIGFLGDEKLTKNACPFPLWPEKEAASISDIDQTLDLWQGLLLSRFRYKDHAYRVETLCHPYQDALAFRIESADGPNVESEIELLIAFPYASPSISAADWTLPERHTSSVLGDAEDGRLRLLRVLDESVYFVDIAFVGARVERVGRHFFAIHGQGAVELSLVFSSQEPRVRPPSWEDCQSACSRYWADFWQSGGAFECGGGRDKRAPELERRVVLSQYLTAIQCAGSLPPQETGLSCNSWYGKFHLEMHYWHAAHFALWGRAALLERSLWYYRRILPQAREKAKAQGYRGARWPKMTDPSGFDSPSSIGTFLCWQEPHPIMYAELLYRARPGRETLLSYADVVFASADFMADYARLEKDGSRHLAPPLIPAQENHDPRITRDPTYELAYWRWALTIALTWQRRMGLKEDQTWQAALDAMAPLPFGYLENKRRVYLSHAACPDTFGSFAKDHPSMLMAFGVLNGIGVDKTLMNDTYNAVMEHWDFESCWGWDFPMMAMSAARLNRPDDAVDALLMATPKNTYLANGHNPQLPGDVLPLYLPGNGALLLAVAMMAAGWDGHESAQPSDGSACRLSAGFPDKAWDIAWEGLSALP